MEISSKTSSNPYTFDYNVKVEASHASFKFLEVFNFLDLANLKKSYKSRIEIGTVETECCRQIVYGQVEEGMLTAVEFERSGTHQTEANPELLGLINAASKAMGQRQTATRNLPISLSELVANPALVIETWSCVRICIFGYCFTCCGGNGPNGPWGTCMPSVVSSEL